MYSNATFSKYKNIDGAIKTFIVELTDGTSTWLVSEKSMQLTDGFVHPLLKSSIKTNEQFNVFTKRWAVGDIQLTLNNLPYKKDSSGDWIRLSDELPNVIYNEATVYALAGSSTKINSLSDCLTIFSGYVSETPKYQDETITVRIVDKGAFIHRTLPQTLVGDVYTDNVPPESTSKKIPVVYGEYTKAFNPAVDLGLARTVRIKGGMLPKFVLSDHVVKAISQEYIQLDQIPELTTGENSTKAVDDSGRGTIQVLVGTDSAFPVGESRLYPTGDYTGDYANLPTYRSKTVDHNYAYDQLAANHATIYDAVDNGSHVSDHTITDATNATPIVITTSTTHGLNTGNPVSVSGVLGNTAANGQWLITVTGTTTFSLDDSVGNGAYTSGGTLWEADPDAYMQGYGIFSFDDYDGGTWRNNDIGIMLGLLDGGAGAYDMAIVVTTDDPDGAVTAGGGYVDIDLYYALGYTETLGNDITVDGTEQTIYHTITDAPPGILTSISWHMRTGLDYGGLPVVDDLTITGASNETPITITTSEPHGLANNQLVTIADVEGNTAANGQWQVILKTSSNFWLRDSVGNGAYTTGGTVSTPTVSEGEAPMLLVFKAEGPPNLYEGTLTTGTLADGTTNNTELLEIYNIYLRIRHTIKTLGDMYAACEGREYGSWITSRSSNYADGDCIEDPAGIIESILRDELGLADADINMPSFIDAENTSMKARINLHSDNEAMSDAVIKQIAEQSTFAYFFSGAGKAKLIPLNDSTPTTTRTIPWSHLVATPQVSKSKVVANEMYIKSRWQQEYDKFRDSVHTTNAGSQITYGERIYNAEWKNICGTSVTHLASHLVATGGGQIWASEHNIIEIETKSFTNIDLEIGDHIELDDTTVDPHILCYGASWSGKQFMIDKIDRGLDKTTIKAIELY